MNPVVAAAPALMLVDRPGLRAEIRRIAAAADRRVDERALPVGRHDWMGASVVLLDTAAARECAAARCPRRPGVLLVTEDEPGLPDWQTATAVGAEQVLALPAAAEALIAAFAANAHGGGGRGVVVAVAGACGGAGASTLAAAIALTAARRRFRPRTLLLDAAPFGGGLDLLLGLEQAPGPRWPDLAVEHGRVAADALHAALPGVGGITVLACTRDGSAPAPPPTAVRAVLDAVRGAGDLLVCDLSTERGAHADQLLDSADLVVLIAPAQLRAVAAAEPTTARLRTRNPNLALLVRGPAPGGLRPADIATALDLPLLHTMRALPALSHQLERGGLPLHARHPLHHAATAVLGVLTSTGAPPRSGCTAPREPIRHTFAAQQPKPPETPVDPVAPHDVPAVPPGDPSAFRSAPTAPTASRDDRVASPGDPVVSSGGPAALSGQRLAVSGDRGGSGGQAGPAVTPLMPEPGRR
ncbi:septum site-determining protein Ssd [Nocardia otitidiscaviarum]|uniref:septum site-determining protein Ssd n=1 Tax=Nocardia otitidiscaviarum TaxID=1823 RepID=UPI0018936439|nr:septum site-determining protein Ssd [Nocardia otitidiscaviarum]MBF6179091.1 hypothetical protein [Nocardia otitidiscaviarum]